MRPLPRLASTVVSFNRGRRETKGAPPREQWCPRALVLVLALCCAGSAFAQPFSSIVGTVTDPTGVILSGVTVTVTNTDTQVTQTVATSATGDYSIPYVVNGTYGLNNVDLMIGKRLFIRNGTSAVFRAEFFNLFNHTNFRDVDKSLTSPGFGTITAAADPRIVQLGLKFTF